MRWASFRGAARPAAEARTQRRGTRAARAVGLRWSIGRLVWLHCVGRVCPKEQQRDNEQSGLADRLGRAQVGRAQVRRAKLVDRPSGKKRLASVFLVKHWRQRNSSHSPAHSAGGATSRPLRAARLEWHLCSWDSRWHLAIS